MSSTWQLNWIVSTNLKLLREERSYLRDNKRNQILWFVFSAINKYHNNFLQNKIGNKAAYKMLVKLTIVG